MPVRPRNVLLTVPGGYLLKSGGGGSDVREFERLAGLGYRAMDAADFPEAARQLRAALALWSGPPLADVHAGMRLATQVKRLEESPAVRAGPASRPICGWAATAGELLGRADRAGQPLSTHESLCGQYMLALYRSGRRGEALDACQQGCAPLWCAVWAWNRRRR